MAKFTSGHTRQVALVLQDQMPLVFEPECHECGRSSDDDMKQWLSTCRAFAIRFEQNNERFDATKFYNQCGIQDRKVQLRLLQSGES